MKDSRLGTYGVTGLFFILLLKFLLWQELSTTPITSNIIAIPLPYFLTFPLIIIVAHSFSRFMPLIIIQQYNYVYQEEVSKSKPLASQKLSVAEMIFALCIASTGFMFLPITFLGSIVFMFLATILLGNYFKKHIGGYTGDCLGTVQQVSELTFYLSILVINKLLIF
jgi:adenosylcobinamide-GDP ribazoletransferase